MKGHLTVLKWMFGEARPFVFPIILILALGVVLSLTGIGIAVESKILIDSATLAKWQDVIYAVGAIVILVFVLVGSQASLTIMINKTVEKSANAIRRRLLGHLSQSEWIGFSKYHSDDILTRMTSDAEHVADGITNILPGIVSLSVQILCAFVVLMFIEPVLAVTIIILGPAAVLFSRFFGRSLKYFHFKIQESESIYRAFMHEFLQNMLVIKAFRLEKTGVDHFDKLQGERMAWVLRRSKIEAAAGSVLSLSYWICYFLAFIWGVMSLSKGAATFGTLAALIQLAEQIHTPFIELSHTLPRLVAATTSAERLLEVEKLQLESRDLAAPCWNNAGVKLEDVDFAYEQGKLILKDLHLDIRPGETVAIVGASGEGKTTLARIILAILQPTNGKIYFINERNEQFKACASSRNLISYIPQGNTLFSGTIKENLECGVLGFTEEEIEGALKGACALDFIVKLPDGIKTVIGERGLGLSEGQAQRLAIARALLHKKPIMIFDEATSELDVDTELKILKSIGSLNNSCTRIIITHRLAALDICSRVLKLESGHISEIQNAIT